MLLTQLLSVVLILGINWLKRKVYLDEIGVRLFKEPSWVQKFVFSGALEGIGLMAIQGRFAI